MGPIALVLGMLLLFQVFYVIPYVRNRVEDMYTMEFLHEICGGE
jgi:hypothetical protein